MFARFHFKSMRSWLTLWFLILGMLPAAIFGGVTYFQRVHTLQEQVYSKLSVIRDLKVQQVNNWIEDRSTDLNVISGDPGLARMATDLSSSQGNREDKLDLAAARNLLQRYVLGHRYYDELYIVDAISGKILLSTDASREGLSRLSDPSFNGPLKSGATFIEDIYYSADLHAPAMAFSTPIFDLVNHAQINAILVARIDLKDSIYRLLMDRTGMGKTGETLIVSKDGLALNELRWHENAPLNLTIKALPAVLAAQGREGVIEVNDYRGVKVLAAYKHIPRVNWGFVSKQDAAEVYAPARELLMNLLIIFVLSSAIIIFYSFAISKRIVGPLVSMKNVASRQQNGELAVRNDIHRADELGFLARAFNELAGSIEAKMNVQRGNSAIFQSIIAVESVQEFSRILLKKLIEITGSRLAAFYLRSSDGDSFEIVTSIGTGPDSLPPFNATSLEGEIGVALASKQIELIRDIPADTRFTFNAVAGQVLPREIITIPLLERGEVKAVVSLASLHSYSAECLEILQVCWMPVSSALVNVLANLKTQRQALELAEKNEELQINTEELVSQSEELREQADELRGTAAELESRRTQVEEADRLKSEFLSNMSHELRTPLNSVLALSQLMISRGTGKDPDEEKNFLEVIERNGRQLLNLINDILDLAKIESGRMDIFPAVFDVNQVVQRALDTVRPLAENKNLAISLNLDTLPAIESDEEKLHQILLNLLSNAIKFTEQGEITLNVTATAQTLRCEVSDTGIGILPGDLTHIFDEFRQADGTTTRKHEGTGLGLSICQKLATLLGGQILVESTFGQGSTFTLELPLKMSVAKVRTAGENSSMTALKAETLPGRSMQRTILVIDDEREVRELVARHLKAAGYEVIVASSGRQGLQLAKEHHPFAITLDILMPDMDGWEVLRGIKNNPDTADIPVTMLSVSEDRATGVALGAAGYLTKPIDRNLLCTELERIGSHKQVKRILIADDDAVARNYIEAALTDEGYLVTQADGGEAALRIVKEYPPDVLLLDLMMPDVDGYMVLDELQKDPVLSGLAVIILTAKDLTAAERSRLKASAKRVIAKGVLTNKKFLSGLLATLQQLELGTIGLTTPVRRKILVVEDNETAALQVRMALEESGYSVTLASDGTEGLASVKRSVPDGMVLDLMMPGVDGFEVLATIRSTPWTEKLPVLVLTAKELTAQDRARLKYNHVHQLIQKGSVNKAQLIAAVHSLLEPVPARPEVVEAQPQLTLSLNANRTVLVVEDNPDNLFTISSTLANEDCVIIAAIDGEQGVEMAEKLRPGLILMDMHLPVMSGMDATQKIKSNPALAGIPIIALTANAMKGDREKMLAIGCNDYLSKPFDPADLQAKVRKWLT
ncbi:response regulator [Geopsychrobacter electrodiphilus]|uniref:response regulator n=1 Tax=Geopsychrobacter electrodiphilus TaxID=225196 RepID=UPI00038128A4|nr:response regulator [Geopsychrobacter electrodiphilus]